MKKRPIFLLAAIVAVCVFFSGALSACSKPGSDRTVGLSGNYFVTYTDRYSTMFIVARWGDELFTKQSLSEPNTYIEKAYYPTDSGWEVYLKNGDRWLSYGTEDNLDDAISSILGPVVQATEKINSGAAAKTGKTSSELTTGAFKDKTVVEYMDAQTSETYWVLDGFGVIYMAYAQNDVFTLAEYYPNINEQTFRDYCMPARDEIGE